MKTITQMLANDPNVADGFKRAMGNETLLKVREIVRSYRPGTEEIERHIEDCERCKAGFLCETANELIEEFL